MTMTVAEAITRARDDILDDPDSDRWTDAEVKRHLEAALDDTFQEYVIAGGDMFNRQTEALSSSAGTIDTSSIPIGQIIGVAVKFGSRYYPVKPSRFRDKQYNDDSTTRNVTIEYATLPVVGSGTTTNPLVADSSDNQLNSWRAFEELVVVRAAMSMAEKDGRVPTALERRERRIIGNVMLKASKPVTRRFPDKSGFYGDYLYWYYDHENDQIKLWRKLA